MNSKFKLLAFGLSALVLIGLLGLLDEDGERRVDTPLLYPELKATVNEIDSVEILAMDGVAVNLHKTDDSVWRIKEAGDYPASTTMLRNLLLNATKLRAVEEKTSNAKYYERLGVADLDQARSVTKLLSLYHGDLVVAELIVGKAASSGKHYVRKLNEPQSWLGSESLNLPLESADWLDKSLLDYSMDRIQSVSVKPAKGKMYVLSRDAEDDAFKLLLDSKPQATDADQLVPLLSALQGLQFEKIAKSDEVALPVKTWSTLKYATFDGVSIEVRNQSVDNNLYVQLSIVHNANPQSEELEPADVAGSVAELQQRFNGRTFVLAAYMQSRFNPGLEKLRAKPADS